MYTFIEFYAQFNFFYRGKQYLTAESIHAVLYPTSLSESYGLLKPYENPTAHDSEEGVLL